MPTAVKNYALIKAAAGDSQTFETALASIGRAAINSRAPSVSKYEIGFQVLDQDDDNTRAVAVFGYKIGGRLFYVPMFYKDGVTKGIEQLRDPKRKRTVPLSDNWINKLTVERGDDRPTLIDRSRLSSVSRPSLWQLRYTPTKWAGDASTDLALIRGDLAPALVSGGRKQADVGFDLLKEAAEHPALLKGIDDLTRLYPWFADALSRYHGPEKIAAALDRAAEVKAAAEAPRPRRTRPFVKAARPKITIVRVSGVSLRRVPDESTDYTDDELGELRAGNNLYDDRRADDDVAVIESIWAGGSGAGSALKNPSEPGVQKVLGDDMKMHDCAVLFPLTGWEVGPGKCLVVRASDGAWCVTDRNGVWVLSTEGVDLDAGVEWHASLKEPTDTPPKGKVAAVFLAPGKHLHATIPFSSDENGYVYDSHTYTDRQYWARAGETQSTDYDRTNTANRKYRVVDGAARLVTAASTLYLPGNGRTKFVDLGYDKPKFRPANGDDPDRFLVPGMKAAADKSTLIEVKASAHGTFVVDNPRTGGCDAFASAADAEAGLVENHHFRPAAARTLIAQCVTSKRACAVVRYPTIKAAEQIPQMVEQNFPSAPLAEPPELTAPDSFADDIVPTETARSLALPIDDLLDRYRAGERYRAYPMEEGVQIPIPGIGNSGDYKSGGSGDTGSGGDDGGLTADDARAVSNAAQSGVKELFDTASMAALVKRKRIDPVLDRLNRSASNIMNDLADGLCHLYWNPDEWAERFGKTEIGAIEDQMHDHFEGLGELTLSLQEKAVDGGRDFGLLPELANTDAASAAGA